MSNDKETFDPYRVLGLPVGATKQQIARRYRHLMRIHHPDVGRDPRLAHERAVQINRAYRILMDDELRARYEEQLLSDAELEIHVPPPRPVIDVEAGLARARAYFKARRYDDAKLLCAEILDAHPRCVAAYELLGAIYAEEGNDRLARNMYNEAQRLAKDAQRSSIPVTPQRVPPEELLVPQRLTVHYWLAAVGVIAGLGLAILAGRVDGTIGFVGISWYGLLSACGGAFTMICCLAAAGAIESFDVEWSGDIVEGGDKTTPLWCYILASAAVWAGFAVVVYVVYAWLNERFSWDCIACFGLVALVAAIANISTGCGVLFWWLGLNAIFISGLAGWAVGSVFSPREWWR